MTPESLYALVWALFWPSFGVGFITCFLVLLTWQPICSALAWLVPLRWRLVYRAMRRESLQKARLHARAILARRGARNAQG